MTCANVGDSNLDIAGLGIVLAAAIQAGLSLFLSVWVGVFGACYQFYRPNAAPLRRKATHREELPIQGEKAQRTKAGEVTVINWRYLKKATLAAKVLETIGDVQTINGIALLIAAINKRETLSLYHYDIVYNTASFTGISFCAALSNVQATQEMRNTTAEGSGNTGTNDELEKTSGDGIRRKLREVFILVFAVLYLCFAILFGKALGKWSDDVPGRCYHTKGIARPTATHPYVDRIYLVINCSYSLGAILFCWMTFSNVYSEPIFDQLFDLLLDLLPLRGTIRDLFGKSVLLLAMVQYPVNLYMVIAIRASNEQFLSGDSENSWSLGQIIALVLLIPSIIECICRFYEYRQLRLNANSSTARDKREELQKPISPSVEFQEDADKILYSKV